MKLTVEQDPKQSIFSGLNNWWTIQYV